MKSIKLLKSFLFKEWVFVLIVLAVCTILLGVTVRGTHGNPTANELISETWLQGPFELSPERGRFALLYSFIEDKSLKLSIPVARFATPDVGIHNGDYVSLFAPLVSFVVIPGYLVGKILGLAQVGTYAVIAIFALCNLVFIRLIGKRLGASSLSSTIAGVLFVFASPAFVYGVSLFQHHISTFLMLSILYVARCKTWLALVIAWLFYALAVMVDYPNALLLSPIILYISGRIIWLNIDAKAVAVNIKPLHLLTLTITVLPIAFYAWFSMGSYGVPFQLSGTVHSVDAIDRNGRPISSAAYEHQDIVLQEGLAKKREATNFFKTRNILNGLYIHIFSPDRGVIYFTPVLLLGFFGTFHLWKKHRKELAVLAGIVGINITLYSMWGDPWGGWAFGSRYLIPSYAVLAILLAVALTQLRRKLLFIILLFVLAVYSVGVNTLGALTTSANPPQIEILALEQQTGKEEKYTYERNWDYLLNNGSKSFVYNTYLKDHITPLGFYLAVAGSISFVIVLLILAQIRRKNG